MATFSVDGVDYELLSFDNLDDFTLGDLRVLEEEGGLSLSSLSDGDVAITTRLLVALVLLSMRRVNPDASISDAERVNLSVLEALAETVANTDGDDADAGDAVPPTTPVAAGGVQP